MAKATVPRTCSATGPRRGRPSWRARTSDPATTARTRRGRLPGQGPHVHVLIRHVVVRDHPAPGSARAGRHRQWSWSASCPWTGSQAASPAQSQDPDTGVPDRVVPRGTAGTDRHPAPRRTSSTASSTWPGHGITEITARPGQRVLPDLTARAESSVDAAGPGRQASRTCPSARPARGGPGGRCAPSATARDPHLYRHPPLYRRLARPRPAHPGAPLRRPAGCRRRTGGGRDTGLTARPEQSGGGSGRTDRDRPPARTARSTAPATPAGEPEAPRHPMRC